MLLDEIARTSAAVAETSLALAKVAAPRRVPPRLRARTRSPVAVAYLAGDAPARADRRRLGGAPRPPAAGGEPVARAARGRRGAPARSRRDAGPARRRRAATRSPALFARATEAEQRFLARAPPRRAAPGRARGRHGRGGGARGRRRPPRTCGARSCSPATSAPVAAAALLEGGAGARRVRARAAAPAPADAGADRRRRRATRSRASAPAAVEWKLDGARVQVHRRGDEVRVFTRNLDDVTARVPEVVEAVLALPVDARRPRRRGDRAPPRRPPAARSR